MGALFLACWAGFAAAQGDADCVACHREVVEQYRLTPMARGSGKALDGVLTGGFQHAASGVSYAVFRRDDAVWMSYKREMRSDLRALAGTSGEISAQKGANPDASGGQFVGSAGGLAGEKKLEYFVGSGKRGRTYLYQEDGRYFEAPINFYSRKNVWDMAPNYGAAKTMPATLPVDVNCLHCHATNVAMPEAEARNKFAGAPFAQGGIGCAACHGDAAEHVRTLGKATVANPAKMSAVRRDSVCLQCHLEGDAAVYRPGTSLAAFKPGDDLSDHVKYFVKASAEAGGGRASSQWEALLRSKCKQASGDRMTCTTCHDPHGSEALATDVERVQHFRSKCLTCHTGEAFASKHHPEQQDCATCHMPTRDATDISHEQATDHNIQRRPIAYAPSLKLADLVRADDLVPVGGGAVGDRELGLAYAQLAQHGNQAYGMKALTLLRRAEAAGAQDAEVHTQLGFLEQVSGDVKGARAEYGAALRTEPFNASALGNLAVLDAGAGQTVEAIALLERTVAADPSQTAAGMNLAFIECKVGEPVKAAALLARLARFNPDDATLRQFRMKGRYGGQVCDVGGGKGIK